MSFVSPVDETDPGQCTPKNAPILDRRGGRDNTFELNPGGSARRDNL
jgi:hypothetical protein